jgi:putative hydrolase of HD superfamily
MKNNINFLFEIGSLRKIKRAWQQVLTGDVQNISEHIFRVAMVAWMIAIEEKADVSKVIRMALIHDIAESRTGDIAFLHRDYVVRHDTLASEHIFKDTILSDEAMELLEEYEKRQSLESKIVKDADNIDVDLELKELSRVGDTAAKRMQTEHRPEVRDKKLYTETAKKMWDEIQSSDPNDWHQSLTNKWIKTDKAAK